MKNLLPPRDAQRAASISVKILFSGFLFLLCLYVPTELKAQACFPGTTVKGAILQKYNQLGACKGFLGRPNTAEMTTPDRKGRYNHFQGGSIYWTPQTGAHEVHGAIRDKWSAMGWERSFLGYPTSDELKGANGLRYSEFQGGRICWTAQRGAWVEKSGQTSSAPNLNTSYNDLIVYFNGYTADGILYVKHPSSGRIQKRAPITLNGRRAYHFKLSPDGGSYLLMTDSCPPKADCPGPTLSKLHYFNLKKNQDRTINL
ncbi:LGFP repeat-containing protein [Flavilitoribacter nigricans]|uniref:LGFP repeat-containing protein n=1 Tax=Flavilitoribacter nigricans (strain ATCC 23147 / DSM 23189 / NBRC 102662 / NCIMB 1420 / SS-2) TaxID=1122177 RepID=A0A2D0NEZ1_FLAN2|nr:hypothetical protein [Flavilitoribacter nigricans]PHN07047.1 hypothetical protein CRP01_08700 [Flavilitoribacter nigricans DSM 23189 = NBRC 102662]